MTKFNGKFAGVANLCTANYSHAKSPRARVLLELYNFCDESTSNPMGVLQLLWNWWNYPQIKENIYLWELPVLLSTIPSGCLTSIVGTQKWGFFLQSTEATPCGNLLK
jgi:hypothetical protein